MAKKGSTKYGPRNKISEEMLAGFNISQEARRTLTEMGSHGLAKSTWSTYGTAERMLAKCRKEKGKKNGIATEPGGHTRVCSLVSRGKESKSRNH
jgi:hypothetical protein